MAHAYAWQGDDLLLFCHVQPSASRDECVGLHGERLKIRIRCAPIDGKANTHLCQFLADAFGVARSQVSVTAGTSSRQKTVRIQQPRQHPAWLAAQ